MMTFAKLRMQIFLFIYFFSRAYKDENVELNVKALANLTAATDAPDRGRQLLMNNVNKKKESEYL